MRRRLAPLIALTIMAGACGDSGATTTVPPATTEPPATTTTTVPATTLPATTLPATTTTTTTTTAPRTTLAPSDPFVTTVGLAPVRVGMTIEEAREAAEYELEGELDPDVSDDCYHVIPDDSDLEGVSFMVLDDKIARVEIGPPSVITTRSGAGIGTSEAQLRAMFPGQIESADEAAFDGVALAFVPRDEIDARYRVIFLMQDGVVTDYRAGLLDAVYLTEGCL